MTENPNKTIDSCLQQAGRKMRETPTDDPIDAVLLGKRLRYMRRNRRITRHMLVYNSGGGLTLEKLTALEQGTATWATLDDIFNICRVLEISLADLLRGLPPPLGAGDTRWLEGAEMNSDDTAELIGIACRLSSRSRATVLAVARELDRLTQ